MIRCYWCFQSFDDKLDICPCCGKAHTTTPEEPIYLFPGSILKDRYIIGHCIGSGGFGIVYTAWDMKLETVLAVKEFYVNRLLMRIYGQKEVLVSNKNRAEYEYRKSRFLAEARTMAKFNPHRSIPNVYDFFEENGTAYIAMEYLKGETLSQYRNENGGRLEEELALMITNEVGEALISLHKEGIIHCDVAPDNIFICEGDTIRIKLMDLGAARMPNYPTDLIDVVLKPGYSPVEQYEEGKGSGVGPWTDVYSLGASLYTMLTDEKPSESTDRDVKDELIPPRELNQEISENLNNAILKAMAMEKSMRFQKVSDFLKAINGETKVPTLEKERRKNKRQRKLKEALSWVAVACCLVGGIGGYSHKFGNDSLAPADISVWYALENGETETGESRAMETIGRQFMDRYPEVMVEIRGIPAVDYEDELRKAMQTGTMPTLYESTGLKDEFLESAIDLMEVKHSEEFHKAMFLDQYERCYADRKQIPLGFEIPMACVITAGPVFAEYQGNYFRSPDDFGQGVKIAMDQRYEILLENNFQGENWCLIEDFVNDKNRTFPVVITSSMAINEIRNALVDVEKRCVFPEEEQIYCHYTYEWSISQGTENQEQAAKRLLSWMLGDSCQQALMVTRCSDGQIPVNGDSFKAKIRTSGYLSPVQDLVSRFVFTDPE